MKIKISPSPLLIVTVWGKIHKCYFSKFSDSTLSLKSCLFLLVVFQFPISDSIAQNFFPLKVGNIYQIRNEWWYDGPGGYYESGIDYYPINILGDTVINNYNYFRFSNNGLLKNDYLFRYDSLNQKVILLLTNDSTQKLGVDFSAPSDSIYTSYLRGSPIQFTSGGISQSIVLGDTHSVYKMNYMQGDNYTYQFSDNIGLSYFRNWGGGYLYAYESKQTVISAILDSIIYNQLELSVDTLYPIFNRPVDTFPYLLTIQYTASYSALVDSFYLDVEHIRSDTLVQTKKYTLSKSNPSRISLYLNGLLEGDKIKLKATITDTSIFNNVDYYPDSGWVVMNLLPPILDVELGNNPLNFELAQNYPNPFNPITTIKYQIPEPAFITIKVYDVLGNEMATLINDEKTAGSYGIEFDGYLLPSGVYYYRITAGDFSQTKKMILLK
jgi:hypothetical protein